MQTENNEMIGFVLFAGEIEPFAEAQWQGECIFTGVPKDSSVFENALCKYLQFHKNTEYRAEISKTQNGFNVQINGLLSASINSQKIGTWSPIASSIALQGGCHVPDKNP